MKFKHNIIYTFLASVTLVVSCISCDEISEDNRYILAPEITAERAVLLEDFTGQYCVNCPEAHEVIEQLEEQYGRDKVIAVSIHCGEFGVSTSVTNFAIGAVGLMTDEGNAILDSYGINQFPMGVIDFGSPENYTLWPTSVRNALQKPTNVDLELSAQYVANDTIPDVNGYFGNIEIEATILTSEPYDANIQFWITEDGIVAPQRSLTQDIPNYVHNNVFRAQVFDGLKGQSVNLVPRTENEVKGTIRTRWTDTEHWEINNLSVVAFVSDKSGILQVARTKLVRKIK